MQGKLDITRAPLLLHLEEIHLSASGCVKKEILVIVVAPTGSLFSLYLQKQSVCSS